MSSLGIDFGTARLMAAIADDYGGVGLVSDRQEPSRQWTRAAVYLGEDGLLAGEPAEELVDADPRLAVVSQCKALLGQQDPVVTDPVGRAWAAEGVAALLLRKLVQDALAQQGGEPTAIALAVPLRFNDLQRRALREAAKVAGIAKLQLVDEPLAVAAFHRQTIGSPCRTTLLLDLGHAGVSASLLRSSPQGDALAGSAWEPSLGIQGLLDDVSQLVRRQFQAETGGDLPGDAPTSRELARVAAQFLEALAESASPVRKVVALAGRVFEAVLFPHQWAGLFEGRQGALDALVRKCVEGSGAAKDDVALVVAYGEGARLRAYQDLLRKCEGTRGLDAMVEKGDEAVACGAALLAQQSRASDGGTAMRTCAHDLGVTIFDRARNAFLVEPLIRRGSPLPATAKKTVYTNRPDQKRVVIQLAQVAGTDGTAVDLGVFEFGPIQSPRKNYPVEVTLTYDEDGIVMVSAYDPESGAKMEQVASAEGGERPKWLMQQRAWVAQARINE